MKGKKIDYLAACKDISVNLDKLKKRVEEFDKYELAEHIKDEIETIKEELAKTEHLDIGVPKKSFQTFMDVSCQIGDCLHEIDMVSGETIKELNKQPEWKRKFVYHYLGIKEISPEYEGFSDELYLILVDMLNITENIVDKYLEYCDEE